MNTPKPAAPGFAKRLMSDLSLFFFPRPSVTSGIASILDLGDTLRDTGTGLSPNEADYVALWSDWRSIGIEIERAAGIESARESN